MHYLVLATESNETETWVVQRTFTSDSELTKEQLERMFLVAHWKEYAEEQNGSAQIDDNWTIDDYEEFYTSMDETIYVDHFYQSTTPIHLEEVTK
mgnify:CR=1 FL=1